MSETRELDEIFEGVEEVLLRYSPPLAVRRGSPPDKRNVHLWSEKEVEIEGRKREEVFFAGSIVQKGYVGLYYMPVYTDAERKELFPSELLPLLKGKSCFHLRRLDDDLRARIAEALDKGFQLYRSRGWI